MKPQKFQIGQPVVIKMKDYQTGQRAPSFTQKISPADILHVSQYWPGDKVINGNPNAWFCGMREWANDQLVDESALDPVDLTSEEIAELVEESISQPVEV